MELDYSKIDNISIEGLDYFDYPDFSDCVISSADYDGEPMTEEMLDEINKDGNFVYEKVINFIN